MSNLAAEIAQETNGRALGATMKQVWRVIEKACWERETRGTEDTPIVDGSRDCAREAIEYAEMSDMLKGLQYLQSNTGVRIQRCKNRLDHPTDGGWADVLVNVSFLDGPAAGFTCELQFVHAKLMVPGSGCQTVSGRFGGVRTERLDGRGGRG